MTGRRGLERALATAILAALLLMGAASAGAADSEWTRRHAARLDALFSQLQAAADSASAYALEHEIWIAWMDSGDPTIDRLAREASAAMAAGQLPVALALLDAVTRRAPGYAEGWNKRATVLYMLGELEKSLADIDKVLALEPRHFGAISGIGLIRIARGDPGGAIEAYRRVLRIYPLNAGARENIELLTRLIEGDPI